MAIRFAAAVALLFNVLMVIIAIIAITITIPKDRCDTVVEILNDLTAAFKEYAMGTLLVLLKTQLGMRMELLVNMFLHREVA